MRGAIPGVRQDGPQPEAVEAWLIPALPGVPEAMWAHRPGEGRGGFSRLTPTLVFAAALTACTAGPAYAMRDLPVGTPYAVWAGIGAVLTVPVRDAPGEESVSALKVLFLTLIVGSVIGLRTGR